MKTLKNDAQDFVSGVVGYLQNEHLGEKSLPKIQTLLTKISNESLKSKEAIVETSVELNADEKRDLELLLPKLVGHAVQFIYKVNKELMGGLKIVIGDWIIDTSYKKQLEQITAELL